MNQQMEMKFPGNDTKLSNTPHVLTLSDDEMASLKDVMHIKVIKREGKNGDQTV